MMPAVLNTITMILLSAYMKIKNKQYLAIIKNIKYLAKITIEMNSNILYKWMETMSPLNIKERHMTTTMMMPINPLQIKERNMTTTINFQYQIQKMWKY